MPRLYISKDLTESASLIDTNFKNIINYLERLKDSSRDTVEDIIMTSEASIGILDINTLGIRHQLLTRVNDTNVTLAIASVIDTHQFTIGWAGTLAASRLNSNVVQAIVNDTNITGSIATQALTLGFTGTLAAIRLNTNVVQAVTNDTNITGTIAAQNLTLGFTGTLSGARGGTGIANTGFTITLAGSLVTTGTFTTTLVQTATVSLTLPLVTSTLLANNLGLVGNTTLVGGTAATGTLTLQSTSHATKGLIVFGTSTYDEANNFLGIGLSIPLTRLHINTGVDENLWIRSATDYGGSYTGIAIDSINNAANNRKMLVLAGLPIATFGGSFGIGTATPATLLDVKGIISSLLGTSTGIMTNIGVADVQTSSGGIGNAADTTDDTLFTYSLPLNAMSANGKSLRSIATGHFATNANTKRTKFWFAGTAIADSAVLTLSNTDWECEIEVTRIDSTHVSCRGRFTGSNVADVITVTPNLVVADLTSNASIVKITGASTITGAANDVLGYLMKTWFEN